ncbi:glycosyl transferase family protein, partial [mine drainage metagenome]
MNPVRSATRDLSVVIPVYNEEASLPSLFERLYPVLERWGGSYEVVFVDDGSRDRSAALLRQVFESHPEVTRVILFQSNFGQHAAILAGFEYARGRRVITLDADLQNPPEEIPRLIEALDQGHDYVGTIRRTRRDQLWRKAASRIMNRVRERIT